VNDADNKPVENEQLPKEGRLAAIDYGTVRIGIAVCDPSQRWTTPCETWNRQPNRDEAFFRELVRREQLVGFVVGLPVHCDGKESQKSTEARAFAKWLRAITSLPVVLFDERFSTSQAKSLLAESGLSPQKRKAKLDQLAAHIILESFLESNRTISSEQNSLDDSTDFDTENV